jgi:hypothetical protein
VSWQELLLTKTWWRYNPTETLSQAYHYFNLVEGAAWMAFAGLVLGRFAQHRKSSFELFYAVAFLSFGLTDFFEAYRLTSGLLLLKGANLAVLLWLRAQVIRWFYPESKVY